MEFVRNQSPRGPVYGANGAYALVPVADEVLSRIAPVLDSAVDAAQVAVGQYLPEALPPVIERIFAPVLAGLGGIVDAGRRETQALAEREHVMLTPIAATAERAAFFGSEIRGISLHADDVMRETKVRTATTVEAAALLALPEAAGLTDSQVAALRERAMGLFYAEKIGMSAKHPIQPTLERGITKTGVDSAAVESDAQAIVAQFHADRERVEEREGQLQSLVRFAAAAIGVQPSVALDRVLAA